MPVHHAVRHLRVRARLRACRQDVVGIVPRAHAYEELLLVELERVVAAAAYLGPRAWPEPAEPLLRRVLELLPDLIIGVELALAPELARRAAPNGVLLLAARE